MKLALRLLATPWIWSFVGALLVFLATIIYLPLILAVMVLDH